jgi:hypothetical protein
MREAISRLLLAEAELPASEELATLTVQLRGHMQLLIPEVEAAAAKLHRDDVPRYCALACLGTARNRLQERPNPHPGGDVAYARRLARALNALVDHSENLTAPSC